MWPQALEFVLLWGFEVHPVFARSVPCQHYSVQHVHADMSYWSNMTSLNRKGFQALFPCCHWSPLGTGELPSTRLHHFRTGEFCQQSLSNSKQGTKQASNARFLQNVKARTSKDWTMLRSMSLLGTEDFSEHFLCPDSDFFVTWKGGKWKVLRASSGLRCKHQRTVSCLDLGKIPDGFVSWVPQT